MRSLSAPDSTRATGQAPQLLLTSRCGQRGGARRPVLASLAESTELEAWTRREKKKLQSPPMTQLTPKFAKTHLPAPGPSLLSHPPPLPVPSLPSPSPSPTSHSALNICHAGALGTPRARAPHSCTVLAGGRSGGGDARARRGAHAAAGTRGRRPPALARPPAPPRAAAGWRAAPAAAAR